MKNQCKPDLNEDIESDIIEDDNVIDSLGRNAEQISLLIDKFTNAIERLSDKFIEFKKGERQFNIKMGYITVFLITLIVVISGILTYFDKIDGATFSFLLGIIVGYLLLFFRDAIFIPGRK